MKEKTIKSYCAQCKQQTNHSILKEVTKDYKEDMWDGDYYYANWEWRIIQCNWCENICFRETWTNSEDTDPETWEAYEKVINYPKVSSKTRQINHYYGVNPKIRNIYRETIDAYNNWLLILCWGWLRAIIDWLCNAESIKDGTIINEKWETKRLSNLQWKIAWLSEKWLLTKQHAELLHEHRFLGNDALHSLDAPTQDELELAIDIIEHTLDNLYEIKNKAQSLRHKKSFRKN